MVVGILKPDSGEVIFDGKPWNQKVFGKIGTLIEDPPTYKNLSARDNRKVRALPLNANKKRIDDVLRTVSLTDTRTKKAGKFSLGIKQRLGIAMALLGNPELLIPG